MGLEIERKFLVIGDEWRRSARPSRIIQGYLTRDSERAVRIRTSDQRAFVTLKGATHGISRSEFEYAIPLSDAQQMLEELCLKPLVRKTRFALPCGVLTWEIDVFDSPRAGLITAEIELPNADHEFERPDWLGAEITGDPRYSNQTMR